jgi:hypothetical protein
VALAGGGPLDPSFFAVPWIGSGEWHPRGPGRVVSRARRLSFRSWTTPLAEGVWLVHDETRWEDGQVERRDGIAVRLGADRLRLTYDDMAGGTDVDLRPDGFSLGRYRIAVAVPRLPVTVLVGCHDVSRLHEDGTLTNTIDVSCGGVALGRQVMRLRREGAA